MSQEERALVGLCQGVCVCRSVCLCCVCLRVSGEELCGEGAGVYLEM